MATEPCFVKAFGYGKQAALANKDLKALDASVADAIVGEGCEGSQGFEARHLGPYRGVNRHCGRLGR